MGAPNALIQKIFMYNGVLIMAKGLFFGNLLGLAFYFSQRTWGWITLDPQTYYLSVAPVILTVSEVLSLNLIFLSVCGILLWLPAQIVLTIAPSKVLRFR
jgi:lipoprotein-releasing system permease protein